MKKITKMNDLQINLIVSDTILNKEGEFVTEDIYNILAYKTIVDEENDLKGFIEQKIKALWKANILTFTGFSYYVNN